jgi:calcium-activated chloride channel regulator 4
MKKIWMACFLVVLGFTASSLAADKNPLTRFEDGKMDLVVSLGWQPTNQDKELLNLVFDVFAKDTHIISQGVHSLGKIHVYTPDSVTGKLASWGRSDVQFLNYEDMASAVVNGFGYGGDGIYINDDLSDPYEAGHTLAHELGHYLYGLYDEYGQWVGMDEWPNFPHTTDDTKPTIMGNHRLYKRFSVAEDYWDEEKRSTAQYRMQYGPGWTTLTRLPSQDTLWERFPAFLRAQLDRMLFPGLVALPRPTLASDLSIPVTFPPVEVVWMAGNEAMILLDRSASTGGGLLDMAATEAASLLERLSLDDHVAVAAVNDAVDVIGPLAAADATVRNQYRTAMEALTPLGGLAMGDALRTGLDTLLASPRANTLKYLVLVVAGPNTSGQDPLGAVLNDLVAAKIPVYPVGLPGADMETLSVLAQRTGGRVFTADSADRLFLAVSAIQSEVADMHPAGQKESWLEAGFLTDTVSAFVDQSVTRAVFSAGWEPGNGMAPTLIRPDGVRIHPETVPSIPGMTYRGADGWAFYFVDNPGAGEWGLELTAQSLTEPKSRIFLSAKTNSNYSMYMSASGGTYPEPIVFFTDIYRDFGILGMDVEATVAAPDGSERVFVMKDDGVSPDLFPGDGVYSAAFADYVDGPYRIWVRAVNLNHAKAGFLAGKMAKPGQKPGKTMKLSKAGEEFSLADVAVVEASGLIADDHGSEPGIATPLSTDARLVHGKIEQDGDKDFFFFDAQEQATYTLFTCGLFGSGMKTLLTLYDTDGATVLKENISGHEGASKILWAAPETARYYCSVEHGSPGTGNYSLGARLSQPSDFTGAPAPGDADWKVYEGRSGDSGGGACFIGQASGF